MTELLSRFSFNAVKPTSQILASVLAIWLILLICGISSVMSRSFTKRQRWFWILTIVCLPGVGLLCYLPFSMNRDTPSRSYHRKDK